jgi:thiamine pyrophosphokinase
MSAVVVGNAPLSWTPLLAEIAAAGTPLLAADGGANSLARIGLKPKLVIGDMDSILPETRRWLGEERLLERPDQDSTDLEKTLAYAFDELALDALTVLAAIGGRTDHSLHNLGLLARYCRGPKLVLRQADEEILCLTGSAELAAEPGQTWSFQALDPAVRVSLEGVRWPVTRGSLDLASTPSTSNIAESKLVKITVEGGPLIVIKADLPPET